MTNRVSNEQLEELLKFLIDHPTLTKGVGLGMRSKETVDKQWNILAARLNSYGSGSTKSGERWKRYWADIKHKSKVKLAQRKRNAFGTNGGPSSQDLSEIDKKILSIIGERAELGDSEHKVPFITCITSIENSESESSLEILSTGNTIKDEPMTVASPSTKGQTCKLYTPAVPAAGSLFTKIDSDPEQIQSGLESSVDRPCNDRPQKCYRCHHSKTSAQSRIGPKWVKKLETRRVAADTKLAEAVLIMAEASRTQAEVAKMQAEIMRKLVCLPNLQTQNLHASAEQTQDQFGTTSSQNQESNQRSN